jgi:CRISPR-associated endonuclease Csn1
VQRVAVTDLSLEDLQADSLESGRFVVRDAVVRNALRAHVSQFDGNVKKAMELPPRVSPDGQVIRKVRLTTKRQIDGLLAVHNGLTDPESKHHVAIYQSVDGTYIPEIVSLLEAARRIAKRQPIVARTNDVGNRLVMSLSKGDMVSLNDKRAKFWTVREIKSNGQITLVPHVEARPTKQAVVFKPTISGLMALSPTKVAVDPIGRVRPAGD